MSYQINYRKSNEKPFWRLPVLIVLCFQLFLALVHQFWPEGADVVRTVLHRTEASAPVFALDSFARDLCNGETLIQAFHGLFHDIR